MPTYGRHKSLLPEERRLLSVLDRDGVERVVLGHRAARRGGGSRLEVTGVHDKVVSLRAYTQGAIIRVQAMCRDQATAQALSEALRHR